MISSHSDCFRALNAPFFCYHKFHIFAIKAQNYHFVSKISQIFYFQNLKLARLKPVSKSKALTCTLCSYDPKEAPNMISSHSDCFRALNAPFFSNHKFHLFAFKNSKVSFFKQHLADFCFQNLKLARLKLVPKNIALTCKMRSYDPKEAPPMISIHSDCFRSLNAPFFPFGAVKSSKLSFLKQNAADFWFSNFWNWRV